MAVNILTLLKPKIFVAENVTGLGSIAQRETMMKIIAELKNSGNRYNVTPSIIIILKIMVFPKLGIDSLL